MRKPFGTPAGALILIAVLAASICQISAQAPALPANAVALPKAGTPAGNTSPALAPSTEIASSASSTPAPVPEPSPDTKVKAGMTPKSAPAGKPDESYIVGIADDLQISVWKEPDLSGPVVVRPDGMITVPVINDVYVVGLTTKQVQDILTEKLKPVVDRAYHSQPPRLPRRPSWSSRSGFLDWTRDRPADPGRIRWTRGFR